MTVKVLLIVEGKKTEKEFFSQMFNEYGAAADIFAVSTNIYSLYSRMKHYDFLCDVKDVLKELSDDKIVNLDQNFTYVYLIFDSDLHNLPFNKRGTEHNIKDVVDCNITILTEMAEYFTNETDPSVGRLYINYPMMESFRYCNCFDDRDFLDAKIKIECIKDFKSLASKKRLAGVRIDNYKANEFNNLIILHLAKLILLYNEFKNRCLHDLVYSEYQNLSASTSIIKQQHLLVCSENSLSVLNSSLFVIIDYYGNKANFYNNLIKSY